MFTYGGVNGQASVLIIDDQYYYTFALQEQLSNLKIDSQTANSGEKGLEILEQRLADIMTPMSGDLVVPPAFKLILCDFSMPGMSGPEMVRRMRKMLDLFKLLNPVATL